MLGIAEMKTIYLKKNIVITRTHDKDYTYRIRLQKPVDARLGSMEVKLLTVHPYEAWTESPDRVQNLPFGGNATLETDSPTAATLFETNGPDGRKRFFVWLMIASPPSYLHELDRWLRARCVCRLITQKTSKLDTLVQTMSGYYSDQSCDGMQSSVLYLSENLKIEAVVRKDFDNSGKVVCVDIQSCGRQDHPFELEGSLQRPAELEAPHSLVRAPVTNNNQVESEHHNVEEGHVKRDGLQHALQGLVEGYVSTVELRSTLLSLANTNPFA